MGRSWIDAGNGLEKLSLLRYRTLHERTYEMDRRSYRYFGSGPWRGKPRRRSAVFIRHRREQSGRRDSGSGGRFDGIGICPGLAAGSARDRCAEAGQQVAAGTVLVELDNQVMRSSLAEVKTQLELAQTLYDKQKRLWDQGVGSEVQYLQAKTQYESLKKRLSSVEAQVGMTQIRAPFSGTVDEVFMREGEYAAPGMAAARLISNGGLRLEMDIPESYLTRIKTGQKVLMDFNSVGIKSEGSISSVGGFISPDSRTFRVTVNLPNSNQYKPNMLASVYVRDYQSDSALFLPNRLILQDRKGSNYTYVYVAKEGSQLGTVERRDLALGVVGGETTEIKGGILTGDRVIDRGIRSVQPKQTVKAITE